MDVIKTGIEGLVLLRPRVFTDARGYFFESYSQRVFEDLIGRPVDFVQDNESRSTRSVIRGFHFQRPPYAQAKLVRCVSGSVLDVTIDIREDSPTYGRHFAVELSADNHLQLFVPRGFAHGFAVLSDEAVFQYKCDNYYAPEAEGGISILDTTLSVRWPISPEEAILSDKDTRHPLMRDFITPFKAEP